MLEACLNSNLRTISAQISVISRLKIAHSPCQNITMAIFLLTILILNNLITCEWQPTSRITNALSPTKRVAIYPFDWRCSLNSRIIL